MTVESYRSTVSGRDGFGQLLLAEWTKLRSVRGWVLTLVAAVALTVSVGLLMALGINGGGDGKDGIGFAPRPLSGDGSVVARVASQDDANRRAKAGLLLRDGDGGGAAYAAVMVTPEGVRAESSSGAAVTGSSSAAPRWLKLTRSGASVTAFESADGAAWSRVGTVELDGVASAAAVGPFVASPDRVNVERELGGESIDVVSIGATARFDGLRLEPASSAAWPGSVELTGSGDLRPDEFRDDIVQTTLSGVLVGLLAIVALAALFITTEYERGTIRTTFAATPRRGRVLAAKATVLAASTLAAGLVAGFGAFLLGGAVLRSRGVATSSLLDGPALRAVVGTAALLAVVALLSLAVATIVRRAAAAISVVLLLLLIPQIIATGLPLSAAKWLERLTPSSGFAIQDTVHRYDTAIGPWGGFGVLCAYAAVALAVATWRLRERDA
jgi:ABC-type transport system involved in multi-copper enzyme maturation permease subunit